MVTLGKAGHLNELSAHKSVERVRSLVLAFLSTTIVAGDAVLFASSAVAQSQPQVGTDQTLQFSIPSQSLASAIDAFSRACNWQVGYSSKLGMSTRTQAVAGYMSPREALNRMLAGTGVHVSMTGPRSAALVDPREFSANADDSVLLDMISVEGGRETAYGPVTGYRAVRASTGTKTDTPLKDIPQSVQVVSRDLITDRQVTSLSAAVETVSSVRQANTIGNRSETFMVRGFAMPGYAIDGVLLNPALGRPVTFLDLANAERVEVLKGPASALFGRGDPGGVINIVTRRPTDSWTGQLNSQVGSFAFGRAEGNLSGPVTKDGTLAMRITGAGQTEHGFRYIGRNNTVRQFASGALRWAPAPATSFLLSYDYTAQQMAYDRGLPVSGNNKVDLPRTRVLTELWAKTLGYNHRFGLLAEHDATSWLKLRATVRYDTGRNDDNGVDFRSLSADGQTVTRRRNQRTEYANGIDMQFDGISTFNTGFIGHKVLSGFEYAYGRRNFISYFATVAPINIYNPVYGAGQGNAALNQIYDSKTYIASGYLQDQITFSPQWKMLIGGRYDALQQRLARIAVGDAPDYTGGAFTGRVGLVYQPIEPVSLYANFAQSFMPQVGVQQDGSALVPERGEQFEVGVKADLIPNQLSATASVFQITKTNVATSDPNDPNANYQILTGKQRVRGAELDVSGDLLPGWQVVASFSYLDARIADDEVIAVGNRLVGVPSLSGSLWTTYEFLNGAFRGLKIGGGLFSANRRYGDLNNSFTVGGYARLDGLISYRINDNLELSVVGRNLTDATYIAAPASRFENHPGAPRSFMASIKGRF